jgi:hypothetical protein
LTKIPKNGSIGKNRDYGELKNRDYGELKNRDYGELK